MNAKRVGLGLFCASVLALCAFAPSTKPAALTSKDFLRFDETPAAPKLETAIVTLKDAKGHTVHLVAAVHVADGAYYADLERFFATQDAVLYEMVKASDAEAPKKGVKHTSAVSGFQRMLKTVLELEFQLDCIDYQQKNFVHADMDVDEFFAKQEERGESLFSLMMESMMREMGKQPKAGTPTIVDFVNAAKAPDRARQYKLVLARVFDDIELQMAGLSGGGEKGSVILDERNKTALAKLQEVMDEGQAKEMVIFYGAAHMAGISKAMMQDMGYTVTGSRWLTAWDMTPKPATQLAK